MKTLALVSALALAGAPTATAAGATFSPAQLAERSLHRRAVEAVVWGIFGPTAPGGKESNWVPTNAGGGFEVLFRFYGPEKPLFDKTWTLPDIEKEKAQP
jgi:hypothetical protein